MALRFHIRWRKNVLPDQPSPEIASDWHVAHAHSPPRVFSAGPAAHTLLLCCAVDTGDPCRGPLFQARRLQSCILSGFFPGLGLLAFLRTPELLQSLSPNSTSRPFQTHPDPGCRPFPSTRISIHIPSLAPSAYPWRAPLPQQSDWLLN